MTRSDLKPILKWAGGKRQLLPQILAHLPARIGTYFEPFVGGGAVFFALAAEKRFERAVLSDQNPDLIEVYRAVQTDVDSVIERLKQHQANHSEEEYYRVREARPRGRAARAARILYLNRTGFNGLYRVNRSGEFNVPFGRYKNPKIVDEARLRAASRALAEVELSVADFESACVAASARDAVYLDPPYLPVSASANFAHYHSAPFGIAEHSRLARTFAALAKRGVAVVLSNSDTADTRRLFDAHKIETVLARRAINSNSALRGSVPEILVVPQRKRSR